MVCLALFDGQRTAVAAAISPGAVAKLIDELGASPSYKVRVQAAGLLARHAGADQEAQEALGRAAVGDPHRVVRIVVASLLGRNPGKSAESAARARQALAQARNDDDPRVRRYAGAAMAELNRRWPPQSEHIWTPIPRGGPVVVAVGQVGDNSGRASPAVRSRLRQEMRGLLSSGNGRVRLGETSAPGIHFVVDASIAKLDVQHRPLDVEATCAVQLVVSRPPRGIITVASGEATVQKPRAQFRPAHLPQMEEEALEAAAQSAYESLADFLDRQ